MSLDHPLSTASASKQSLSGKFSHYSPACSAQTILLLLEVPLPKTTLVLVTTYLTIRCRLSHIALLWN